MNLYTHRNELSNIENKLIVTKGEIRRGREELRIWD